MAWSQQLVLVHGLGHCLDSGFQVARSAHKILEQSAEERQYQRPFFLFCPETRAVEKLLLPVLCLDIFDFISHILHLLLRQFLFCFFFASWAVSCMCSACVCWMGTGRVIISKYGAKKVIQTHCALPPGSRAITRISLSPHGEPHNQHRWRR